MTSIRQALRPWFAPFSWSYLPGVVLICSLAWVLSLAVPGYLVIPLAAAGGAVYGSYAWKYLLRRRALAAERDESSAVDDELGVFEEESLRPALEAELARSRRFNHEFALVLVGVDELSQRFRHQDARAWMASTAATAAILRSTRLQVDRVYKRGERGFALVLPEAGPPGVESLVRRLNRMARHWTPAEGELGGPLPVHFGATFFPKCATTAETLLQRAEITLQVACKNQARLHLDGAEAPDLAPPATLRRAS